MKCNTKTMVTIALTLALVLPVGHWALPQFRGSLAPLILVACMLVCPMSMLFMMRGSQPDTDKSDGQSETATERKS